MHVLEKRLGTPGELGIKFEKFSAARLTAQDSPAGAGETNGMQH